MPRRSATPDIPGGVMLLAHPPSKLTTMEPTLGYRSMSTSEHGRWRGRVRRLGRAVMPRAVLARAIYVPFSRSSVRSA